MSVLSVAIKKRYLLSVLLLMIAIYWSFSDTILDYSLYRKLCFMEGDVAIKGPIKKGAPWLAQSKSDAEWAARNFPAIPFVRYESENATWYDVRDAGVVMGRAHEYEEKKADLSVEPLYMLKREDGVIGSGDRIRYYRLTISDLHSGATLAIDNVFGFTWWTLGGAAYGAKSNSICFDPDAVNKIRKAFKSKD